MILQKEGFSWGELSGGREELARGGLVGLERLICPKLRQARWKILMNLIVKFGLLVVAVAVDDVDVD